MVLVGGAWVIVAIIVSTFVVTVVSETVLVS